LKNLVEKPKRSFLTGKGKQTDSANRELRDEFRDFLLGVRDNVSVFLWEVLQKLAIQNPSDRKYEANVYALFGRVTSTFGVILANFDPSAVTRDLLDFLKARLTRISDEAFNMLGNTNLGGEGERRFLNSVTVLEKTLGEVSYELSKYYKRDEKFEAQVAEAMKNR